MRTAGDTVVAVVIENDATDVYDRRNRAKRTLVDTDPEWQAIKARLDRGEWLSPGDAAKFLGISRTKVHLMLKNHELRHRTKVGSKHRVVDPAHLLRIHAGTEVVGPAEPPE